MSRNPINLTLAPSPTTQSIPLHSCRDPTSIIQIILVVLVIIFSIFGNGAVCMLLVRFKTLRTVPNILVVNLAFIDVINALVNMPLFIMWYQCKVTFLGGKTVSFFVTSFYVLFMNMTVVSLVVLMLDRYGAIVHGLKYHSWKTRNKALEAVVFIWLAATTYTYGQFALGAHVDIGAKPVWMYRIEYFKIFGRAFVIAGYAVPFFIIVVLGILIWRVVRMSRISIVPKTSLRDKARNDVQTAKTIGITIVAYFWLGCFPVLLHSIARVHGSWLHFLPYLFIHTSSMANPIIYSLRTQRFRRALILLLREPFGRSQPKVDSSRMTTSTGMITATSERGTGCNLRAHLPPEC